MEEKEQDEIINTLTKKYRCEDVACPKNLCYPDAVTGKHIHLMHQHLRFWSSGVVSVCTPRFSLDLIVIIH